MPDNLREQVKEEQDMGLLKVSYPSNPDLTIISAECELKEGS